ncbi:N-acetyltransferase [bacterium]|nr:N-acetyltransferase [bacterium]
MSIDQPLSIQVEHKVAESRFEVRVADQLAFLSYTTEAPGRVSFDHTFVPETLRGQGVAAALVRSALTEARQRGWKVVPRCSYVAAYLRKHPEAR